MDAVKNDIIKGSDWSCAEYTLFTQLQVYDGNSMPCATFSKSQTIVMNASYDLRQFLK